MKAPTLSQNTARRWLCKSCTERLSIQLRARRQPASIRQSSSSAARPSKRELQKLPDHPARTRFAPSPTGFLHLGSLRTALFNFLLARATKGQFVLRIEDTDTKRTVPGALDRICRDLEWAGLQWDEGPEVEGPYGPYLQSKRTELYQQHATRLLDSGHAYRCFCSTKRLQQLAEMRAAMGLPIDYDRTCEGIDKAESDDRAHRGEKYTVRLKVPQVYPEYFDLVYGRVGGKSGRNQGKAQKQGEVVYEDPILLKSDGFPTYHLANVVDDHLMNITHVVRAAEWMPSTPKHLAIYEAFGWDPPKFAHVGLLQDVSGQKLSKRNADVDTASYQQKGYFPETLVNFCALLGWSHSRGSDVMSMDELIESFDLKFTKGNTVVDIKKLQYLQNQHASRYIHQKSDRFDKIVDGIVTLFRQRQETDSSWQLPEGKVEQDFVKAILLARPEKYISADDFLTENRGFFVSDPNIAGTVPDLEQDVIQMVQRELQQISEQDWEANSGLAISDTVTKVATDWKAQSRADLELPLKKATNKINGFLRRAILGSSGPPMAQTMQILGRATSLERLNRTLSRSRG